MGLRAKENIHIGKIIMFFYFGRMSLNVLIEPFFLFKTRLLIQQQMRINQFFASVGQQ